MDAKVLKHDVERHIGVVFKNRKTELIDACILKGVLYRDLKVPRLMMMNQELLRVIG